MMCVSFRVVVVFFSRLSATRQYPLGAERHGAARQELDDSTGTAKSSPVCDKLGASTVLVISIFAMLVVDPGPLHVYLKASIRGFLTIFEKTIKK